MSAQRPPPCAARPAAPQAQERRALGLLASGHSYKEICAITEWTYTKVNRCVTEGRRRLRELEAELADAAPGPRRAAVA